VSFKLALTTGFSFRNFLILHVLQIPLDFLRINFEQIGQFEYEKMPFLFFIRKMSASSRPSRFMWHLVHKIAMLFGALLNGLPSLWCRSAFGFPQSSHPPSVEYSLRARPLAQLTVASLPFHCPFLLPLFASPILRLCSSDSISVAR